MSGQCVKEVLCTCGHCCGFTSLFHSELFEIRICGFTHLLSVEDILPLKMISVSCEVLITSVRAAVGPVLFDGLSGRTTGLGCI